MSKANPTKFLGIPDPPVWEHTACSNYYAQFPILCTYRKTFNAFNRIVLHIH